MGLEYYTSPAKNWAKCRCLVVSRVRNGIIANNRYLVGWHAFAAKIRFLSEHSDTDWPRKHGTPVDAQIIPLCPRMPRGGINHANSFVLNNENCGDRLSGHGLANGAGGRERKSHGGES